MPTPDELRATLDEARAAFRATLESASENWDRKPEAAEGEAAWSARQVAQHAAASEVYFAKAICDACGYPGPEVPRERYATPAEAIAGFDKAVETSNSRIKYVTETDLPRQHESMGSVADMLATAATHLNEHAEQVRAATA
jgi:hypothetical protein